jgi:HEAT repeat protein
MIRLPLPEALWVAGGVAKARIRKMDARIPHGVREKFSWALTFIAVVAACLTLAGCGGWAQGTRDAHVAAHVHEQIQRLGDKDSKVRDSAAWELVQIGPEAVPALSAALTKDPDTNVRFQVLRVLGQIGPDAKEAVPALITALAKDPDADVPEALGAIGPGAREAVPALITTLAEETDPYVRSAAAEALGQIGPGAREAVPALITTLAKDTDAGVREDAAKALAWIRPDAKEAVPALIITLAEETDSLVLVYAAQTLGQIGPGAREAVPALITTLAEDDRSVRAAAAEALGQIGPGAREAVPALITTLAAGEKSYGRRPVTVDAAQRAAATALGKIGPEAVPALTATLAKDTSPPVRTLAAEALGQIGPIAVPALTAALAKDRDEDVRRAAARAFVQIAEAARDSKQTDMIEELARWPQALEANSFPLEAARVRTAIDLLRAIQPAWYKVLFEKAGSHPGLVGLVAAYLLFALLWLALLWKYPLALWRINEILEHLPKVKLPGWLGGVEISVANLCLVGFFHYHPRVLDGWVSKHMVAAQDQFATIATVQQREVHVEVPVELDRKVIPGLKAEDLKAPFARNSACLLIWGEGGAGKTSLACQVARWGMSEDAATRPCAHRMLPVMIEQDLDLEVGQGRAVLTEVIRGD